MTGPHIHLLVNHIPILGVLFALALLIASLFVAGDVLKRTAFVVLVGVALGAAAANLSGEPAEDAVEELPSVGKALIHQHEEAAEVALISAAVLGVFSLIALVRWRRAQVPRFITGAALAGTVFVAGTMTYTGLRGGRIRHTEVRPGAGVSGPASAASNESADRVDRK